MYGFFFVFFYFYLDLLQKQPYCAKKCWNGSFSLLVNCKLTSVSSCQVSLDVSIYDMKSKQKVKTLLKFSNIYINDVDLQILSLLLFFLSVHF